MSVEQTVGMVAIPAAPGIMARLSKAIQRAFCAHGWHGQNPLFGVGRILVTCKRNKPEVAIPGLWLIRLCQHCGEHYSASEDRVE